MDELRGPAGPLRNGSDLLSLELAENLVQQRNDLIEQTTEAATTTAGRRIEQTGNSAQQVPEQVALTRLCRDVQMDHVEVDDKAKQVEIQRPERQVEDLAARDLLRHGG